MRNTVVCVRDRSGQLLRIRIEAYLQALERGWNWKSAYDSDMRLFALIVSCVYVLKMIRIRARFK
jgi:hypothetical protein